MTTKQQKKPAKTPKAFDPTKRQFTVKVSITGTAHVTVEATDAEDVKRALWAGEGTDGVTEWEYDEVLSVTEDL